MKNIPLSVPFFNGNEKEYVDDAITQGWVSTGGAYITKLEKNLSKYLNVDDVAACQSGTSALHLCLIEAGVRPGDLVIVSPLTFIAAVNPIRYQFARPIFIDCDDSLCIDPIKVEEFCENECVYEEGILKYNGKIVKAIVVVHIFGNMADMVSIMRIARKYNIKVIEDATEALGTRYTEGIYKDRFAGTIGDYGAFSFNGNKIITTGGGGAVTSNICERVKHMRYLSTQAKDDEHYYIHNEIGYNYRMTNLQAALGVAQLEELQDFIIRKKCHYEIYENNLKDFRYGKLMGFRNGISSNRWFYSLEIDRTKIKVPMKMIIEAMQARGIQTRAIWGLINEQIPYQGEMNYEIKKAKYYAERILNLPSSPQIEKEDILYVIKNLYEVLMEFEDE